MKTLFIDSEDFHQVVPEVNRAMPWATHLRPKVEQDTELRIIPFVSRTEYDALEAAIANPSPQQAEAIRLLRWAVGYYAAARMATTNRMQIGSAGNTELRGDDGGMTSPASFHTIADVQREFLNTADFALDSALGYMELHRASFPDWVASDAYTRQRDCLIWNSDLFRMYVSARPTRRALLAMRPALLETQRLYLRAELGDAQLDGMLARLQGGVPSAADMALMPHACAWLGKQMLVNYLPQHGVIDADGLWVRSYLDGSERKYAAGEGMRLRLLSQVSNQADTAREAMKQFLITNADNYPDFEVPTSENATTGRLKNRAAAKSFRA